MVSSRFCAEKHLSSVAFQNVLIANVKCNEIFFSLQVEWGQSGFLAALGAPHPQGEGQALGAEQRLQGPFITCDEQQNSTRSINWEGFRGLTHMTQTQKSPINGLGCQL